MFGRLPESEIPAIQPAGGDNSTPNNDTVIEINEAAAPAANDLLDAPEARVTCYAITAKAAGYAAISIPIVNAAMEAVQTAIGLSGKSAYFVAPVTTFNFFSALGINMKFTTPGIQKSFSIIKNRELPAKWHKLSKAKEITAAVTAVSFAAYSSFTDSVLGYFFLMELPATYNFTKSIDMGGWKVLSTVGAAYTFIGIFTSEGIATYKQARKLLGGIKPRYKNKASGIISPTLGFVLGTFNSINDSIATFGGMKYVFDITSTPALGTVLALSTINGVTDYSINGLWVIECLDDFIGSFTPAEGQSPAYTNKQVIAAFAMSLGAGSLLAYAWHSLSKAVVNETLSAVGINATYITDPLVEVLACGGATSNFVNGAGSIYPVLYKAAGAIGTVLTEIYNRMPSCCQAQSDMIETDPLLGQTNEEFLELSGSEPEKYSDDFFDGAFVDALDYIPVELDGAESDAEEPGNDAEFFDLPEDPATEIDIDNLSEDERTTAAFLFNLFTPQRQIAAPANNNPAPFIKK